MGKSRVEYLYRPRTQIGQRLVAVAGITRPTRRRHRSSWAGSRRRERGETKGRRKYRKKGSSKCGERERERKRKREGERSSVCRKGGQGKNQNGWAVTRRDKGRAEMTINWARKWARGGQKGGTGGRRGKSGWQAMEGGDSELDGWSV